MKFIGRTTEISIDVEHGYGYSELCLARRRIKQVIEWIEVEDDYQTQEGEIVLNELPSADLRQISQPKQIEYANSIRDVDVRIE